MKIIFHILLVLATTAVAFPFLPPPPQPETLPAPLSGVNRTTIVYQLGQLAEAASDPAEKLGLETAAQVLATWQAPGAPQIATLPWRVVAYIGRPVTLQAATVDGSPVAWQWRGLYGYDIDGATAATWTFTPVSVDQTGVYSVVATNWAGSSAAAIFVEVDYPPPSAPGAGSVHARPVPFARHPSTTNP